jgi:hypothetical protein
MSDITTCLLCNKKNTAIRHAYRTLREKKIDRCGFCPRISFSYEEISKLIEGSYSPVCMNRRKCLERQRIIQVAIEIERESQPILFKEVA